MTLQIIKMHPTWEPQQWDEDINTRPWTDLLTALPGANDEDSALRLLALLSSFDSAKIEQALNNLKPGRLYRGARLLGMVALGRYAEVYAQRNDYRPEGIHAQELFDALNYNYATGISAIELGDISTGLAQLHTALFLAEALRMTYKIQHLMLEIGRVSTRIGKPDPEKILRAMTLQTMTQRRSRFASCTLAEAYMALGDYETARNVAPEGSGLKVFLAALTGQPVAEIPDDDYGRLAQLLLGQVSVDLPCTSFEPEMTYTRLLQARELAQTPAGAAQALALLEAIESQAPDQRVLRALLLWELATEMPNLDIDAKHIWDELARSTVQIPNLSGIASVLKTLSPRLLALMPWVPDIPAALTERGVAVPLLMGNALLKRGRFHLLPGNAGAKWFTDDLARRRRQKLHPMEVKRMRLAIETCGPETPVSGAWVLHALLLLARTQTGAVRSTWQGKLTNFTSLIQGVDAREAACALING